MSKYNGLYIGGIEHLAISEPLGRGEKVGDSFFVTNDRAVVTRLLSPRFRTAAGALETAFLTQEMTLVAYAEREWPSVPSIGDAEKSLLAFLLLVRRLFHALWLVKDNAASMEFAYFDFPHHEDRKVTAFTTRRFLQGLVSQADGRWSDTPFTREELRRARQLFDRVIGPTMDEPRTGGVRASRWNTALYFLDAARMSINPGVKIANYCTCLEAMFATEPQELSHKLCERVAYFLAEDTGERVRMFREMKGAYGLRSKIVHGDKKAIERGTQAKEVSVRCDDMLRRVLLRVLDSPELTRRFREGEDADMEEYLLQLVFTGRV